MMADIRIVRVQPKDVEEVARLFARDVYGGDEREAQEHLADHATGGGDTFLAYAGNELAGYVTIRWVSHNPLFRENNIPLIQHLEVFPAFQRRGIAWRLMDEAEALIATRAKAAGITVGLFDAYGPAQRLYARRGYIPDGRGACRGQQPLRCGEQVTLDHDLILWLTKDLTHCAPLAH